ncbi:MAG: OAM dimerization domain-containing protein [Bacillota bacterium]
MTRVDLTRLKPYGDTLNDGKVQVSLTLPVPAGAKAREAVKRLCGKMGMVNAQVVHMQDLGEGFSFFVVYGGMVHTVDYTSVEVAGVNIDPRDREEIDRLIRERLGRKLVVVGACIESDAHTVGIDAIFNAKGYNGRKGLESYQQISALNLGAQVPGEILINKAVEAGADAILVSQVVTQKDIHLQNLTRLVDLLEAEGLRDSFLLVAGGPRITHELAKELGYDVGFGPGACADDVASFMVDEIIRRKEPVK